jgi:alpha-tubulin suppressor-like RCC1 family protein
MRRTVASMLLGVALMGALVPVAAPAAGRDSAPVASASRLALGMAHTCLIEAPVGRTGPVRCFGYGYPDRRAEPIDLGPGPGAVAVAAGDFHTCAILGPGPQAGSVRCWGDDTAGQLGAGGDPSAGPVDLGPGRTARALAAGSNFTCALLDDGAVRCWGGNGTGQLGTGSTTNIGDDEIPTAVAPVSLGGPAVAVAAAGFHACAILTDGSLRCWGGNGAGQLGTGNTHGIGADDLPALHPPVRLGFGRTAVAVDTGVVTTCAILDTGAVRCWGYGGQGALGLGHDESIGDDESPASVLPVRLGEGRRAAALALGAYHSCALLDDGAVRCWGPNGRGELGYGDTTAIGDAATPDQAGPVGLGARAVELAAGGYHTCALLETGTLRCWGPNDVGPLIEVNVRRPRVPAAPGA